MRSFFTSWFAFIVVVCLSATANAEILSMRNANGEVDPESMDPETQKLVQEQYELFMKNRRAEKEQKKKEEERKIKEQQPQNLTPNRKGISPKELNLKRKVDTSVPVTEQVGLDGGSYFFGTQMTIDKGGKIAPTQFKDGADVRKLVTVKPFAIDEDCVTNGQFAEFVRQTQYESESELFGWSFVLDSLASEEVIDDVDGDHGYGRVKGAEHWMAVKGANWKHPFGPGSSIEGKETEPVVQVSYVDALEYCSWLNSPSSADSVDPNPDPDAVVRKYRLPTEKEWEYAARGGMVNKSYTWGDAYIPRRMNIWEGDFPKVNTKIDGYHGVAPTYTFPPNDYGLYNMIGNVWEWVAGGTPERRVLRGGSFIDSPNGEFNHAVRVSTRQVNTADSAGVNVGFRCASSISVPKKTKTSSKKTQAKTAGASGAEGQEASVARSGQAANDDFVIEL